MHILETEGRRDLEGTKIIFNKLLQPLKIKKVNIGSSENPKFANIGDYWDDEILGKITNVLHEYQDLFPTKFFEMKGIV